MLAAFLLRELFPNSLAPEVKLGATLGFLSTESNALKVLGIEAILTFFLVITICATAVDKRAPKNVYGFAIGLTIYPITRFLIEFIRGDEPGLFGTRFTISQWISAAMFLIAIGYLVWLSRRPAVREPICTEPLPTSGSGVSAVARTQPAAR